MKSPARVAIVGRPNVGKSTLFNRVTRQRKALVHPTAGVTRDAQRLEAEWTGFVFELIDTGGLFSGIEDELVREVEVKALEEALSADVMIFVTDAEVGVTPPDVDVADRLRELEVPVFLVVNKAEKAGSRFAEAEFYKLGYDNIYPISALHGEGIGDLLDAVVAHLPKADHIEAAEDLKLALVGRPNVGKSSLINALIGKETQIVDSRPGTTRDSLDLHVRWHDRDITLVDTAGIKRRSRTRDSLSSLTAIKSIDAIERADIVVMVLDASQEIANQDVKVASYAHKSAKGLMFCVNKWDLIEDKSNATVPEFEEKIRRAFSFITYAPILFASALTSQRVSRILSMAWQIKEARDTRIGTSQINQFIEMITAQHPPPFYGGGNGKVYYGTQVGIAPPTFTLFVNKRAFFGRAYLRYLNNKIREKYEFDGTLIRIKLVEKERKGEGR